LKPKLFLRFPAGCLILEGVPDEVLSRLDCRRAVERSTLNYLATLTEDELKRVVTLHDSIDDGDLQATSFVFRWRQLELFRPAQL
jgi:hypothetical protein